VRPFHNAFVFLVSIKHKRRNLPAKLRGHLQGNGPFKKAVILRGLGYIIVKVIVIGRRLKTVKIERVGVIRFRPKINRGVGLVGIGRVVPVSPRYANLRFIGYRA
jgi:hypothetical protein